ncbi:MAG: hypothetical protein ACLP9L_26500 [Thermoguttaceae bacterium]
MRKVFADTLYWVAIVKPNDHFRQESYNVLIVEAARKTKEGQEP